MTLPSCSSHALCAERSTQALVPDAAAAFAQGTPGSAGFGCGLGAGFGFGLLVVVGAGLVVVVSVVVGTVTVVVGAALVVEGTPPPVPAAAAAFPLGAWALPPEHAASTNAVASAAAPTRSFFTTMYPQKL